MEFKYYDLLSSVIVGYFALIAIIYSFGIVYNADYTVGYLAASYVIGYLINAIGSLLEGFWYRTIGGMPSDILLSEPKKGKFYTGTDKVKFYHRNEVVEKIKDELNDESASNGKMFSLAMRYSNSDQNTRVPDFNAQFAFSRTLLTALAITTIFLIISHPCVCTSYIILIADFIAWRRFKDRGYYYAREVLNEYLNKKKNNGTQD